MSELSNKLTARARILHRTRFALKAFGYNKMITWIEQNVDRENQDAILVLYQMAIDRSDYAGPYYEFDRAGPEARVLQELMTPILKRATEQSFKTQRERYIESKK
ncbi:hypothetical protein LCGC14_0414420 [marine sediment metagenome]|uniref:Uncharacterized protein n=1 Tax=marine sediment metagenome TaxID=412755 RepID=A0A0F9TAP0_9ZZZZ